MAREESDTPKESVRIRPAQPEDIAHVQRLREAGVVAGDFPAENEPPPHVDEDGPLDTTNTPEGFWVAEVTQSKAKESFIVGTIGLRPLDAHVVEARRLFVEPKYRGRGIGIRLLRQLVETCREMGYLKVVLDVGSGSPKAVGLFTQLGFQLAREREFEGRKLLDFYLDIYRDTPR